MSYLGTWWILFLAVQGQIETNGNSQKSCLPSLAASTVSVVCPVKRELLLLHLIDSIHVFPEDVFLVIITKMHPVTSGSLLVGKRIVLSVKSRIVMIETAESFRTELHRCNW
jgi:hypothetical protein